MSGAAHGPQQIFKAVASPVLRRGMAVAVWYMNAGQSPVLAYTGDSPVDGIPVVGTVVGHSVNLP